VGDAIAEIVDAVARHIQVGASSADPGRSLLGASGPSPPSGSQIRVGPARTGLARKIRAARNIRALRGAISFEIMV
jgi:hypothetical protein